MFTFSRFAASQPVTVTATAQDLTIKVLRAFNPVALVVSRASDQHRLIKGGGVAVQFNPGTLLCDDLEFPGGSAQESVAGSVFSLDTFAVDSRANNWVVPDLGPGAELVLKGLRRRGGVDEAVIAVLIGSLPGQTLPKKVPAWLSVAGPTDSVAVTNAVLQATAEVKPTGKIVDGALVIDSQIATGAAADDSKLALCAPLIDDNTPMGLGDGTQRAPVELFAAQSRLGYCWLGEVEPQTTLKVEFDFSAALVNAGSSGNFVPQLFGERQ